MSTTVVVLVLKTFTFLSYPILHPASYIKFYPIQSYPIKQKYLRLVEINQYTMITNDNINCYTLISFSLYNLYIKKVLKKQMF